MLTFTKATLALLTLGLSACSTMSMSDHSSTFRASLEDAQAENSLHATNCAQTSTMTDMGSEMQRHDGAFDGVMGGMMDGMDMMNQCSCCDTASMQTMMGDLETAETDHRAQMGAVTDITEARSLCKSHTDAMSQTMGQMSGAAQGCMGN